MDFQQTVYTIDKLIEWTKSSRLALPEFQRDFVWSPSKVVDLLDSVSRGWPIGSLLLLKGPQSFQPKKIDSAPDLRGQPDIYILDGQQRVTALYHALMNCSDVVYFVDIKCLIDDRNDYIKWQKKATFDKQYRDLDSRAADGIALIGEIADDTKFLKWYNATSRILSEVAPSLRERHLFGFKSKVYQVAAIELPQDIELEALARIFETINRTGVRLNAFDLMVAVLFPYDFNLREKWELAWTAHASLELFDVEGIEILKLVALWERERQRTASGRVTIRGVRQGDVLAVSPAVVKRSWDDAVAWYTNALGFLRDRLGVTNQGTLPASAMVLTLAYLLRGSNEFGLSSADVERWFWHSVAYQTYSQGANTQVVADVDRAASHQLSNLWAAREESADEAFIPALLEPARRNRILMRGICSALTVSGARDPFSQIPFSQCDSMQGIPVQKLAQGDSARDESAMIAQMLFLDANSAKEVAKQVKSGRDLRAILDARDLGAQGFIQLNVESTDQTIARASWLTKLLNVRFSRASASS